MIPALLNRYHRGLSLSLVLGLFCAQLVLAWHAPAHIDAGQHSPNQELLASADSHICPHGHGMLVLPSNYNAPVVTRTTTVALTPAATVVHRSERNPYPPRGPPVSA